MARKLIVEIIGDSRSLEKTLKQADRGTSKFGSRFGTVAKAAGVAGFAIGAGVAVGLKKAIDSANAHAVALAQTRAVLKSTGGVANVTAKQITGLADAIEKSTGMDDLAIQAGENLLATFTNIRNEVGKGNDIFTQATKTVADMSQALGQDTKSSALQLGKALQDPVKGLTALQRVGVIFTKGQKDQIKALVDSGRTMDAQKVILRELNKEFGGSAEAAGKTLPGQLNILKARLDDVAQRIGEKLVPALVAVVDWVNLHWPEISRVFDVVFTAVTTSAKVAVDFIRENWPQIREVIRRVSDDIRIIWAKVGPTLTAVFRVAVKTIVPLIRSIAQIIKGIAQVIDGIAHGDWAEAWRGLKNIAVGAVKGIRTVVVAEVKILGIYLKTVGKVLAALILFPINKAIDALNAFKLPGTPAVKIKGHTVVPGLPSIDPIPNIGHVGFGGGDIVIHNTVELDGQKVAANTTKHQARAQRRTAAQRTGRVAGLGPVVG